MDSLDKHQVFATLRQRLADECEAARASQQQTQAGATHEESRPENDKDTRALEASYLARGQARRVAELEQALVQVQALAPIRFGSDAPVALGAIVEVDDDETSLFYLLAPAGGGLRLDIEGRRLTVVTPASPVGRALLGRRIGDDVDIRTPQGLRECSIAGVF